MTGSLALDDSDRRQWRAYILYDGLGSTSELTDGSASVVDGYTYDVFRGPEDPERRQR